MPTKRKDRLQGFLQQIGVARDGLLVTASALYLLGYLVWSIHAAINHLGLLPAIDSQYFAAGIIPFLIITVTYPLVKGIEKIRQVLLTWYKQDSKSKSRLTVRVAFGLYFLALIIVFLAKVFGVVLPTIWIYVTSPSLLFIDFVFDPDDRYMQLLGSIYTYTIPLFFAVFAILFYVLALYPIIPQELGGVRPRCAYLDIAPDQLSAEVREVIFPNLSGASSQIARSSEVYVLFSGNDFILVTPVAGQTKPNAGQVYEIRRDSLQVITWCDQ